MSTVISKNVQIGADGTASNNFTAYQPATPDGTLRIGNGNSGSVTDAITLTSAGNVGIGTSSPTQKLHVQSTGGTVFNLKDNTAAGGGYANIFFSSDTVNANGFLTYNNSTNAMAFGTNNTERARIDSAGNVGIGTSSPASKLTIQSAGNSGLIIRQNTSANRFRLFVGDGTGGYTADENFIASENTGLHFMAGATGTDERMTLTSAGNLGLGVTPSSSIFKEFEIGSGSNVGNISQDPGYSDFSFGSNCYIDAGGWKYKKTGEGASLFRAYGYNGQFFWQRASSGTAGNAISFTQAMTLNASGDLLLGSTYPLSTSKFYIKGQLNTVANGIGIETTETGTSYLIVFLKSGLGLLGSITTNGTTTTAYNTSSDYRLKNTIAPMTGALAKVALLNPVTYKWNSDGSDGQGFIAHELDEVVKGCVTGEKDAVDKDGNPQYQGIDTSFLVATLTSAIKEQQALIVSLTARLDAAGL